MWNVRITYARPGELRDDVKNQMLRGALLVRVPTDEAMQLHDPVKLHVLLPSGVEITGQGEIVSVLAGHGLAVSVAPEFVQKIREGAAWRFTEAPDAPVALHEMLHLSATDISAATTAPAEPAPAEEPDVANAEAKDLTQPEKMHLALHGTRDERNAILRDRNRLLHPFVLKNTKLTLEDVAVIAKNAQISPEMLKLIADRKDWFQRPAVALALARNPKTPPDVAIRALEHVPVDALKQMAKGVGALPHVVQAARKRVVGRS